MDKNKIIQAATKYVQRGQLDRAIAEYKKARRADPKDVRILLKIGDLQQKKGEKAQAADTLLEVAKSYAAEGFFLKAVAVYKQIVKLDPSRVGVNVQLAELYQQLGLNSDAMGQLEVVAAHYEREGNAAEALNTLRRMVDLDPDNVTSRIKLGELFAQQGQSSDALRELRISAEHLKSYNRMDDYLRVAERICLLDPEDVGLSLELAELFLQRRDARRALARLQVCFNANPKDPTTLDLLARAFRELGQLPKAVAVYKEMAKIHREAGEDEKEREAWAKVLDLSSQDPEAIASLSRGPAQTPAPRMGAARPATTSSTGETARRAPAIAPPVAAVPPARPREAPKAEAKQAAPAGAEQLPKLLTEVDVYIKYGLFEKASAHLQVVRGIAPKGIEVLERQIQLHLAQEDRGAAHRAMIELLEVCLEQGERERGRPFLHTLIDEASEDPKVQELLAAYSAPEEEIEEAPRAEASVVLDIEELEPEEAPEQVEAASEAASADLDPAEDEEVIGSQQRISTEDLASRQGRDETAGPSFLDLPEGDEELFQAAGDTEVDDEELILPDPEDDDPLLVDDLEDEDWIAGEVVEAETGGEEAAVEAPLLPDTGELDDDALFRSLPPLDDESLARPEELELDAELLAPKPGDEEASPLDDGALLIGEEIEEDEAEVFSVKTSVEESFGPADGPVLGGSTAAWEEARAAEAGAKEDEGILDDSVVELEASGGGIGEGSDIEMELLEGRFLLENEFYAEAEEKFRSILRRDPGHEEALRLLREAESGAEGGAAPSGEEDEAEARRAIEEAAEPLAEDEPIEAAEPAAEEAAMEDLDRTVVQLPTPEDLAGIGMQAEEEATVIAMDLDPSALMGDLEEVPAKEEPAKEEAAAKTDAEAEADHGQGAGEGAGAGESAQVDEAAAESAALAAAAAEAKAVLEASKPAMELEPVHEEGSFDLSAELASEWEELEAAPAAPLEFQYSVDDVLAEFKKGVSQTVSAEDSETHYNLGIAYKEMGLLADAIAEFEVARKGSLGQPKEIDCLTMAGMCEALLGDHEAAIERFLGALGLPSVTPEAAMALHFEIGLSFEAMGEHDEALSHFGKVARIDPGYRKVEEAIRRLEASEPTSRPSRQQEGMG